MAAVSMFSVGVLYSSQAFLSWIKTESITIDAFRQSFGRFEVADAGDVLALVQKCRWVTVSTSGTLQLTERGHALEATVSDPANCLRGQLADLIIVEAPAWSKRLLLGRFEVRRTMPLNAEQCFRECGLFGDCDDGVVDWWDLVTQGIRSKKSNFNVRVGRAAERFTVIRELERVGRKPTWQAIESNVSGFDVLSLVDRESADVLQIEVKGSLMRLKEAIFFVSRNEWQTAENSAAYEFHLWLIHEQPQLFVVPASKLSPHLPQNCGGGQWENASIRYRDFEDLAQPLSSAVRGDCNKIRLAVLAL